MAQRSFLPETNHSNTIGTNNRRWKEAYIDNIYSPILDNTTLSGTPTAPTPDSSTNNTQVATTAFVHNIVDNMQSDINELKAKLNALLGS